MRLPGEDLSPSTTGGLHRRQQRPCPRLGALRRRIRRVGIRGHEPRPRVDGADCCGEAGEAEVDVPTHHDGVHGGGIVVSHDRSRCSNHLRPAIGERLDHAGTGEREHALPRTDQRGSRHGRGKYLVGQSWDAGPTEVLGHRGALVLRVVGDEEHRGAGAAQPGDRLGSAGKGLVGEPHHPVEIEDPAQRAGQAMVTEGSR